MEESNLKLVNITAKNIKHIREGLKFTAVLHNKKEIEIQTEILGRHNVSNILASILVAKLLGMNNKEIKEAMIKIKPIEIILDS